MKANILFFGEFPQNIVHGISISNEINFDILSEKFNVIKVHESSKMKYHAKFSLSKFYLIFKHIFLILGIKLKYKKIIFLYSAFSISRNGIIKNIIIIFFFKLINRRSKVILHNYRGDFKFFYKKNKFNFLLSKILLSLTYKVIFLSESLIPDEFGNQSYKFFVVPNCVKANNSFRNNSNNEFVLLYISHYIESKGIYDLLSALEILDSRKFLYKIILFGQFINHKDLVKIKSYSSQKIVINDFLSNEKKMSVIAESSCLILPSHNEGQPQIILEAMSVGTPVIATDVGDIPSMLGLDYPFLVPTKSPEHLANAIEKFWNLDKIQISELSENLIVRFINRYSYETHKDLLINIFY